MAKGDFILIDYVAKVKETGETFDTSIADVAKEANIYRENTVYEPMLVVVGEGWVIKGLDEQLEGLEVGQKATIEVPPEKGFGPRDPSKIKLIPLRKFREQNITPYPGMEVQIDGKPAIVRSVGAGRVQVDFNLPLAGKTLIYEVEVKRKLETLEEKVKALLHRRAPAIPTEKVEVQLSEGGDLKIVLPEETLLVDNLQPAKRGLVIEVFRLLPEVKSITFEETYKRKEGKPSEKAKPPEGEAKPEPGGSQSEGK
ncbi:MAG: FKBP-type peptidyl-prolyl cis-trans isomerase [Candidatus Hecatellaceae archaeon]